MSNQKEQSVQVLIGVVSSTRGVDEDGGGVELSAGLEKHGHRVVDRVAVDESKKAIRRFVLDAQDRRDVNAVVVVGGTGLSRIDHSYEAVGTFLDKEIPGFGECLRAIILPQLRSKAMHLRAVAGVVGTLPVFVLPGDPSVCRIAGDQLLGPELGGVLADVQRSAPSDEDIVEKIEESEAAPDSENLGVVEEEEVSVPAGWERCLQDLGGDLTRDTFPDLPDWLVDLSAAQEVLNTSGERGLVRLKEGYYVALGFPDLRSPRSRVLLLGQRSPRDEILALHRWPMMTGICAPRVGGVLPHRGRMGKTAEEVTGVDYPAEGRLFAMDSESVYILDGAYVQAWDGKKTQGHGLEASALASLLLRWTQH